MAYEIIEVLELFDNYNNSMEKVVDNFSQQLLNIRAGRANPHILDKIMVSCYGSMSPLNQVANISVAEARLIVISVWDASLLKAVEKAIIDSNIGITPNNDGRVIRLVFPELTQERRIALVKEIKSGAENAKVALRNARREANDLNKRFKKDNVVTEDDFKNIEKDIDKELADYVTKIEEIYKDKESEIMSV